MNKTNKLLEKEPKQFIKLTVEDIKKQDKAYLESIFNIENTKTTLADYRKIWPSK